MEVFIIRKIEIERFSLVTSKNFEDVVAVLNADIGHPNMAEFGQATRSAQSITELQSTVDRAIGKTDLTLFMELDHGAIVSVTTGRKTGRTLRFIMGNPLIMKEMVKHVPDAGSYAPVTVLVDEREDGVHLSYDRMVSFIMPYGNADALEVARNLDAKVEDLLKQASA